MPWEIFGVPAIVFFILGIINGAKLMSKLNDDK